MVAKKAETPTPQPDPTTLAAKAGVPAGRVLRVEKAGKGWRVVTWETNRRGEPTVRNGRLVEVTHEVTA